MLESSRKPYVIDVPNNQLSLSPGQTHVIHVTINSGGRVEWKKETPNGQLSNLPQGVAQQGNDLVITNARPEISGNYACTVFLPTGQIKEVIIITVNPTYSSPPQIISPNQKVTNVRKGAHFRLECTARGSPTPSIRIETPRKRVLNINFPELSSLRDYSPLAIIEIDSFESDNAGLYTCIAENEKGERAVETFQVNEDRGLTLPPTIIVHSKQIRVAVGSNVIINTTYTGTEPVRTEVNLYGASSFKNLYVNEVDKSIEIRGVTKENEGQYIITASNDYGQSSDFFNIQVVEAPGPKIFPNPLQPTTLRVKEGSAIRLEPNIQFVGVPFFSWTGPDETSSQLISNAQQSDQYLTLSRVVPGNDGVYTLNLLDSTGSATINYRLIVEAKTPDRQPAVSTRRPNSLTPFNIVESQVIELEEDETAMLVCALKPERVNPREMIFHSWSKTAGRFPRNIRPNIERLQILKFTADNAGDYKCTVATSGGYKHEVIVTLMLKQNRPHTTTTTTEGNKQNQQPPSASIQSELIDVRIGEDFEVNCKGTGASRQNIVWFLNQEQVTEGHLDSRMFPRQEKLYVRGSSSALNGFIICRVIDEVSGLYGEDSVEVRVTEEVTTTVARTTKTTTTQKTFEVRVSPEQVVGNVGDQIRLVCASETRMSSLLMFEWSRVGGQSLPPTANQYSRSSTLVLTNLEMNDMGVYMCRAVDRETGVESMAQSRVIVSAPAAEVAKEELKIDVSPKSVSLVQGDNVEFLCDAVSGGVGAIYVWERVGGEFEERHISYANGRKFRIMGVQPSDRGYFRCRVDNTRGRIN